MVALFMIAKNRKQSKNPSTGITNEMHLYRGILFSSFLK
jgi:hypothetical protein